MKTRFVLFAGVAVVLVGMLVMLWLAIAPKNVQTDAAAAVPAAVALAREHAATAGSPDAKVHIVEFLDPACETCREFYPLVKRMLADNPDRIRLSVRLVAFHKGSDFVVKALEASKAQGKFWQVLERLLASQSRWAVQHTVRPELAWEQLQTLGLDMDQLKADMESPAVARNMALDAQDARALKVMQTPEYFVNGRGLPSFGYEQLQALVAEAMATAYR
jgi:protein-disulfide isomerase